MVAAMSSPNYMMPTLICVAYQRIRLMDFSHQSQHDQHWNPLIQGVCLRGVHLQHVIWAGKQEGAAQALSRRAAQTSSSRDNDAPRFLILQWSMGSAEYIKGGKGSMESSVSICETDNAATAQWTK